MAGVAWNTIYSKILTGLANCVHASLLHGIPRGLETVNGHLSPCVQTCSESESCYQARTKAKISSDVLDPKIASEASHLTVSNSKKFPWGASPQTHLASAYTLTYTLGYKDQVSRTNAILFLPGLWVSQ